MNVFDFAIHLEIEEDCQKQCNKIGIVCKKMFGNSSQLTQKYLDV